ncbi:MAG: hypothetical protein ACREYC_16840 [Gammaproteobacteria bacterium]
MHKAAPVVYNTLETSTSQALALSPNVTLKRRDVRSVRLKGLLGEMTFGLAIS